MEGRVAGMGAEVVAAGILRTLSYSRIGYPDHTYPGMLDMYSDFTMLHAQLGTHVEVLEMDDLHERMNSTTEQEVQAKIAEITDVFAVATLGKDKISIPVTDEALNRSAQVAMGLDKLVHDFDLSGYAYYYRGLNANAHEALGAALIVGNSLLTARGIQASGEGDLKTGSDSWPCPTKFSKIRAARFGLGRSTRKPGASGAGTKLTTSSTSGRLDKSGLPQSVF